MPLPIDDASDPNAPRIGYKAPARPANVGIQAPKTQVAPLASAVDTQAIAAPVAAPIPVAKPVVAPHAAEMRGTSAQVPVGIGLPAALPASPVGVHTAQPQISQGGDDNEYRGGVSYAAPTRAMSLEDHMVGMMERYNDSMESGNLSPQSYNATLAARAQLLDTIAGHVRGKNELAQRAHEFARANSDVANWNKQDLIRRSMPAQPNPYDQRGMDTQGRPLGPARPDPVADMRSIMLDPVARQGFFASKGLDDPGAPLGQSVGPDAGGAAAALARPQNAELKKILERDDLDLQDKLRLARGFQGMADPRSSNHQMFQHHINTTYLDPRQWQEDTYVPRHPPTGNFASRFGQGVLGSIEAQLAPIGNMVVGGHSAGTGWDWAENHKKRSHGMQTLQDLHLLAPELP